jgi:NAD(P)H-hydrate repair Nnr-like enzyme with NAD(P)H-hydrate dehydratase domain
MDRLKGLTVLVVLIFAGCASAPEQATLADAAATHSGSGQTAFAVGSDGAPDSSASAVEEEEPTLAVLDASTFYPGSVVVCKDMLKPGSNVVITQCMTRDDWKRFERALELQAQQMLRQWQGSGFR